jgi:hypothetical protein
MKYYLQNNIYLRDGETLQEGISLPTGKVIE